MRTKLFAIAGSALLLSAGAAFADENTGSIGLLSGGVPQPNAVASTGQAPMPGEGPMSSAKPVAYQDPQRGFMLVAPPGARFVEREGDNQITIQSRKGFAINLHTGDANPAITTYQMFAKLEAGYLGEGKPWSTKTSQNEAVIAGLPAVVGTYDAGSTRTKVVIARGQKTDFVFMFFAPASNFEQLQTEFDWVMTSFRPAPSERPAEAPTPIAENPTPAPAPLRAEATPSAAPAGRPAPVMTQVPDTVPTGMQVFAESGYGYRVSYPMEWQLEKVSAFTNVFSGKLGTPAYDAIVSMQNVKPHGVAAAEAVTNAAFNDLKTTLTQQAGAVDIVGEKAVTYAKGGLVLAGRQFVASYEHNGRRFRKWALVLPRPDGEVAHIWSYTAPVEQFDTYRPVAEQMLNSLKIEG